MALKKVIFWTQERIQFLVECWQAGETSTQIAKKLGTTKNAVISKSRRVAGIDRRENPIIFDRPDLLRSFKPSPLPPDAKTLPPLPALTIPCQTVERKLTPPLSRKRTCQWIEGDPKKKPVQWCRQASIMGKSWCEQHYARVFTHAWMEPTG
jgi:hypothetical protein